jgi:hypothetical protein
MPAPDSLPAILRRQQRTAAALLALAAGCGCAQLQPTPPAAPPPAQPPPAPVIVRVPQVEPADAAARHLLAWQDRVAAFGPAELAQEIARLGDDPTSPQSVMDLALALAATRVPADLVRAQGLLDQVQRDKSAQSAPWQGLARLLAARFAEQRRAEEQAERLGQQLRDSQRDNQRKLDQLNDKLEALKAIERSLNTRAATAAGPASAAAPAPARTSP